MDAKSYPKWFQNLALGIQGSDFEILGGFDRGPIFDDFLSGQHEKNLKTCDFFFFPGRVGVTPAACRRGFGDCKVRRIRQSARMSLGRPVPCEQVAADCYPLGSSAEPTF